MATTPYPGPVDERATTTEASELFTSFFTAKTRHEIDTTHAFFHPGRTYYADATLGWRWTSNEELRGVWEQYMPQWDDNARSYPVQVLGDTSSAALVMTDTPELFGGEIRAISIVDLADDKIVRWVDYWDGRGFGAEGAAQMRVPTEDYPQGLGVDTVEQQAAPALTAVVDRLSGVLASGDAQQVDDLLAYDATLEDLALRTTVRGRTAIARYLKRAGGRLPYQGATVTHVVGADQGGGFEWTATGDVPRGAAALTLDDAGKIASLSIVWDGSLLDDDQITALTALVVEPRR